VDVVANPAAVSDLLSTADIAVMPLRRGGGTRIKALEAMGWGLPIVATSRAVEGLRVQDGVHVRIAETAEAFVAAVVELCEHGDVYESQRSAAHRHLEEHFRPDIIRRAVREALHDARTRGRKFRAGQ
jgi:glycosyltransferase involved in cell wall biosynthesis